MKKSIYHIAGILVVLLTLFSCSQGSYSVPADAEQISRQAKVFPDYTNITIPSNIAPLNFMVQEKGEEFVCSISDGSQAPLVSGSGNTGIIQFDIDEWHAFIGKNKGKTLTAQLYKKAEGKWVKYPSYTITVAEEDIDPYLSYRLIEPGYELYRLLGLYQRNLTNFEQVPIVENPRLMSASSNTYCINCHNYQNYSTKRMLFHARSSFGGTILAEDGKIEKLNTKNDSILGSAVYPSWHPTKNWLVFSSNLTGQTFHIKDKQKVEVIDHASDIIFYNADTKEISNVVKTHNDLETFPVWAPDGKKVYYCVSKTNITDADADSVMDSKTILAHKELKYDIMGISFDEKTMTFGQPELVFSASSLNKSASVPRVSPDGKYLLFTLGDYGQFHIWHKSSDLYVMNLADGTVYPLKAANSPDVDSYHSWSSNGRWIVFSSRRDDGSFTRSYITYFDKKGVAHKAFMLPQEDPTFNIRLFKSFNVPELTKDAVPFRSQEFQDVIEKTDALPVKYKEIRPQFK